MIDQATQLRNLALAAGHVAEPSRGGPRTCVLVGGKGGVGVTTLAVNMAAALAQAQTRTVLLETAPQRADLAPLCGLDDGPSLAEVLASRVTLTAALQSVGPGWQVVGGAWAPQTGEEHGPAARQRLLRDLAGMGERVDQVLLDVSTAADALAATMWQACDEALIVTTPDDLAVMDTYALVKRLGNWPGTIGLVVNRCPDAAEAEDVFRRLDRSCRRFLGFGLASAGHVPEDPLVLEAAALREPLVQAYPDSAAGLAISYLAAAVASHRKQASETQTK